MYAGKTLDTLQICPTFERFEFMNWSEEGEVRHWPSMFANFSTLLLSHYNHLVCHIQRVYGIYNACFCIECSVITVVDILHIWHGM